MSLKALLFGLVVVVFGMQSFATVGPEKYVRTQADGSQDILTILPNNDIILEKTRQVGGGNKIEDKAIVPNPTVCREQISGTLVGFSKVIKWVSINGIVYKAHSMTLADRYVVGSNHPEMTQEANDKNCSQYVDTFNSKAQKKPFEFDLDLSDFQEAK